MSNDPRRTVDLVIPGPAQEKEFLARVEQSSALHLGWVQPPTDSESYARYLRRVSLPTHRGFLAMDAVDGHIVGVVNINEIVLGSLRSASLGYYGFKGSSGGGRMTEAVRLAVDHAFKELGLHRVEANIQPTNRPSRRLVERLAFRLEGFSPRFLYVQGDWRDHERWAVLSDEWERAG